MGDIHGFDQGVPGSRSDSSRRYSLRPPVVSEWSNFFSTVLEMPLDNDPLYARPTFHPDREFTIETQVHDIFRVDVGSVRRLPPFAKTHATRGLPFGVPDLLCSCVGADGRLTTTLFPIEMKRSVYLHLDDGVSFQQAYEGQGSSSRSPAGPLKQIYGYMKLNGYRYGVLSTYTQTWFIKRVGEQGNDVLVSPTIYFNSTVPTLLQCYLWLIRTASVAVQMEVPDRRTAQLLVAREQFSRTVTKVKRGAEKMLPRR